MVSDFVDQRHHASHRFQSEVRIKGTMRPSIRIRRRSCCFAARASFNSRAILLILRISGQAEVENPREYPPHAKGGRVPSAFRRRAEKFVPFGCASSNAPISRRMIRTGHKMRLPTIVTQKAAFHRRKQFPRWSNRRDSFLPSLKILWTIDLKPLFHHTIDPVGFPGIRELV